MVELERRRSYLSHCRSRYQPHLHRDFQDAIFTDDDARNGWHSDSSQRMEKQRSNRLNHSKAINGLQLRQLDRHRDRLLFGHRQSCFNHNGRAYHRDG